MDQLRKARRPLRREFGKLLSELENLLLEEVLRPEEVKVKFKLFTETYEQMLGYDHKIKEQLTLGQSSEADEDKEYDEIREFNIKFEKLRMTKEKLMPEPSPTRYAGSTTGVESTGLECKVRSFKLPTIEMKKFSGKLIDWLAFWGQFRKIDEAPDIHGSDKFGYLLQSLEPGTDAYEIAIGYPQSDENYTEVINSLKRRYGSEDTLLQVYVRQLLNLVITNVNTKDKPAVKTLYHKLDSHIRALRTLNLEKADPATWIFPLVESCLPEATLDNWQRSPLSTHDGSKENPPRTRLDLLMAFLEREVEIGQKLEITRSFSQQHENVSKEERKHNQQRLHKFAVRKYDKTPTTPALASFVNADEKCVFCGKQNHVSGKCYRALKMTNDERREILRKNNLCFKCCGSHYAWKCKTENLDCNKCHEQHFTLLCGVDKREINKNNANIQPQPKRPRLEPPVSEINATKANLECSGDVALQTVLVKVKNGNLVNTLRAFIDSGSQKSYILKKSARRLGLKPVGVIRVVHSTFGGRRILVTHNKYKVNINSMDGNFHHTADIREQDVICVGIPKPTNQNPTLRKELCDKDIILTDESQDHVEIEMLIGSDLYAHILTGKVVRLSGGAIAIHTKLGWTLLGQVEEETPEETLASVNLSMAITDANIAKLWDMDVIGIREPAEENAIKRREELVKEEYISNIVKCNDGRYTVGLPWKENIPSIPHNKEVAFKRLQSATRKLLEKGLYAAYNQVFVDWETEGFIERVPMDQDEEAHYLPHRPVIKDSLTTPVRPVFDASCRVGSNPSLNDCLFKGENCISLIFNIIQKFREKKVAYWADIRKAFQTIGINVRDRDKLRFLWWSDETMKKTIVFRHARLLFGATSSPFILAVVIFLHLSTVPEEERKISLQLLQSMYVDNCIGSTDTVNEYCNFRTKAIEIMKRAQMDLRMWTSNVEDLDNQDTQVMSVLGLIWDRKKDVLCVNVKSITIPEKITKREVLSTVHKVFDPVGFTLPCMLPMKTLLQRIWIKKLKWDDELPENERKLFVDWCEGALELNNIKIPRLFTNGVSDRSCWSLHCFTDASKDAYAAVVFLRVNFNQTVSVQMLAAKSRISPVKEVTIPKLELMSCLIGARLMKSVKNALELEGVVENYYNDSTSALAWIWRNDLWGTFVYNRTREINQLSKPEDWKHVVGENNPADLPSRGCLPSELLKTQWWMGPKWMYQEESTWPITTNVKFDENEVNAERKKSAPVPVLSFSIMDQVKKQYSFIRLVRIVGWVRRFLHNRVMNPREKTKGDLTHEELEKAELRLVREIQLETFTNEGLKQLGGLETFTDNVGVLRVKTRLTYREELGNFRYPMLLPYKRPEVQQLILDLHKKYCHAGVGSLMTKIREKYWILKVRRTVKAVISKCPRCRRFSSKHVVPEPAPLPLDRIKDANVFEVIGVDLAGPLILRNKKKAWLVIFTCAVYRAVHFEVVKKIDTKSFICALELFVEKYRRPSIIYSDNGTNFRGADNLFKRIKWNAVEKDERMTEIEWKFNPVTSSWWGGFFERLIRTAKDLLRRTVGKGSLDWIELKMTLKSVAEAMNSRPLTYVSEDPSDLEPLTPALFLHPFGSATLPEKEMTDAVKLRFRLNYVRTVQKELKQRFLKEYLALLVNRRCSKATRELRVGELVLVGNDSQKRLEWPLGKVMQLIPGRDNVVRLAKVKTERGELIRSVQRLYPLEADSEPVEKVETMRTNVVKTRSGRVVKRPN